jgi:hypothetical protein
MTTARLDFLDRCVRRLDNGITLQQVVVKVVTPRTIAQAPSFDFVLADQGKWRSPHSLVGNFLASVFGLPRAVCPGCDDASLELPAVSGSRAPVY